MPVFPLPPPRYHFILRGSPLAEVLRNRDVCPHDANGETEALGVN